MDSAKANLFRDYATMAADKRLPLEERLTVATALRELMRELEADLEAATEMQPSPYSEMRTP